MILIASIILPVRKFRRDASLLKHGIAAAAKITSRAIVSGRGGAHLAITYTFVDGAGRAVSGARVLWGDIEPNGRTSDPVLLDALAAPTVFYERQNPQSHLFYPSSFAAIQN